MAGQVVIRAATVEDVPALLTLYDAFHDFHVRALPDRLRGRVVDDAETRAAFAEALARDNGAILLAEVDGRAAGLVEVYIKDRPDTPLVVPRRYGYVQSLVVLESYRRHGLGRALMDAARNWAAERGAEEMELEVWEFPESALAFYASLGYVTLKRTLARPV